MPVSQDLRISVTYAIAPFSLFLLGTAFAPIYTPHLSERFGRRPIYFVAAFVNAIFTIGSSQAMNIHALCATRFFSGLFGGPIVVLIEGTYADIWPPQKTLLYYSNLAWASYLGAAAGKHTSRGPNITQLIDSLRSSRQRLHRPKSILGMDSICSTHRLPSRFAVCGRHAGNLSTRDRSP